MKADDMKYLITETDNIQEAVRSAIRSENRQIEPARIQTASSPYDAALQLLDRKPEARFALVAFSSQ